MSLHRMKLGLAFAGLLLPVAFTGTTLAEPKVLRFVPQLESTVLDPVTSILQITHQTAFLPYDTLVGRDASGKIQPQMLESFAIDANRRLYTFVLRPSLRFHDGSPVRAADAAASVKRWTGRDNTGIWLARLGMKYTVIDERTFSIETPKPTPLVMEGLGQPFDPPFIMREKEAMNPPEKAVSEIIGSGPFRFIASEYVPGSQYVYERNPDYVPRDEPASAFAGGKRVFVDRVQFRIMPDPATVAAALGKGEVDIWEALPLDLLPLLKKQPGTTTRFLKTGGLMLLIRPNFMQPPFDNPKARQALLAMVNQDEFMAIASGGDPSNMRACHAFMGCSTEAKTEAGMDGFMTQNLDKARQLLKESGYDGRPVVLMDPTNFEPMHSASAVAAQVMRQVGFNVDVQTMDWATLVQRRAKQDPTSAGGWNVFLTIIPDMSMKSPISNPYLDAPCHGGGWYGWPCDEKLNALRDQWATEGDPVKGAAIYQQIQERSVDLVPLVPLGEYFTPIAYRSIITDVVDVPLALFWNVKKAD